MLQCDAHVFFWATFENGEIKFGLGEFVGDNVLLEITDTENPYRITSYSVHNSFDPTAMFGFYKSSGNIIIIWQLEIRIMVL